MNYPIGMFSIESEQHVPLQHVGIDARITDLFCDVTVTQSYRNAERQPIEAVYTFPLPVDAVLLAVEATLGENQLHGAIVPRQDAEAKYEHAVVSGDAAILLQRVEPGMYAMNLGNLLPGEQAVIRFRYGLLLRWNGDSLRFHLPTTIAPRYGTPTMAPHLVPQASLAVDHAYRLDVTVEGLLAGAEITSPTHQVVFDRRNGAVHIALAARQAFMDRDFVLNLTQSVGPRTAAMSVVDGDGFVALLSWKPTVPHSATPTARAVKIVVDCSGSMNGDSITQARIALRGILQKLRANDFFDIVRFGSRPQVLFGRLEPASGACLQRALTLAASLDADLGGTEIGDALSAAFAIATPGDAPPADILLITDGEVHATDPVITGARRSGHRVFTIGVGSTVAEAFVRQLAEQTGGACELVTPNEEMPARIVRHFQRIFLPRITELRIAWPRTPLRQPPVESRGIFEGDTVHAFAWLPGPATGQVGVEAKLEDGRTIRDAVQLISPPTPATHADAPGHPLARLAAAAWVGAFPEDTEAMALRYQLLTDRTDFLITHVRAENAKATQLPALRTVPQMLAAGWGGAGSVLDRACLPAACRIDASRAGAGFAFMDVLCAADMDLPLSAGRLKADHWAAQLGHLLHWNAVTQQLDDCTLALLERAGVPDELVHALRRIVDDSIDEAAIVLAFLAALAKSAVGQALDRQAKRVIAKAMQGRPTDPALSTRVSSVVSAVLLLGNPSPVE